MYASEHSVKAVETAEERDYPVNTRLGPGANETKSLLKNLFKRFLPWFGRWKRVVSKAAAL
jgi:hypothetical protein